MGTATYEKIWMGVGFAGQLVFTARFLVQWAVSEKRRDSVVPVAFWWISLFGGMTLLAYAVHRQDPPIIMGQAMGLVVYVRNLMLVDKSRRRAARARRRAEGVAAPDPAGGASGPGSSSSSGAVPRPHRVDPAARGAEARPG